MIKVFIENEAGSDQKNVFNEKTLEHKKTFTVSARYPFPYGFILDTTSGDGDNLDCFVLTKKPLKSKEIIEAEPIGMFEQIEDGETDNKVLAVPVGESWTVEGNTETIFREFGAKVFSHRPNKKLEIGSFLGLKEAISLIQSSKDKL